ERLRAELAATGTAALERTRWSDTLPAGIVGCVISNELADALPVHALEKRAGALSEVYVSADAASSGFAETLGEPSSLDAACYLDRFHVPWRGYPDGWRAEVCLAAEEWMRAVAASIARGYALTIDYGDTARRLYTPERRRGTLATYSRHHFGDQALAQPGRRDLTAHVNFSALVLAGWEQGLRLEELTTQAAFLERQGIRAEAEALGRRLYPAADTERWTDRGQADLLRRKGLSGAVATLLNPRGLGGFRALTQRRRDVLIPLAPSPREGKGS
ncbi:MAG: SAM-dependent methyltransferase, partial [Ktedonobacterales bacterium]